MKWKLTIYFRLPGDKIEYYGEEAPIPFADGVLFFQTKNGKMFVSTTNKFVFEEVKK